MVKHAKRCPKNPANVQPQSQPQSQPTETEERATLTNKQWLQNLKSYWSRPGSGLSDATVDSYIGKIKVILSFEERMNSNFKAQSWENPSAEDFQNLRQCDVYVPKDYGAASLDQVCTQT